LLNRDKNIAELANEPISDKLKNLSDREIEIIKLISNELSTNQIAEKLFLSPAAIETHCHNSLKKLGIKSAIGLMRFAISNKIV
jgi:DNA-binding NarL/FixJ family response regulator